MRRYTISINDIAKVVDVEAVGANLFRVQIDGRLVDVTLDDHRDLAHSVITPEMVTRTVVPAPAPITPTASATTGAGAPAAPTASGTAAAPAASGPRPAPPTGGGGRDKLTSPMPGVILTVDTAIGAAVKRGDSLLVLEAMKMKNELKAPKDGVVAEIYVAPGQQVKYGEILVRFEA